MELVQFTHSDIVRLIGANKYCAEINRVFDQDMSHRAENAGAEHPDTTPTLSQIAEKIRQRKLSITRAKESKSDSTVLSSQFSYTSADASRKLDELHDLTVAETYLLCADHEGNPENDEAMIKMRHALQGQRMNGSALGPTLASRMRQNLEEIQANLRDANGATVNIH